VLKSLDGFTCYLTGTIVGPTWIQSEMGVPDLAVERKIWELIP